MLRKKLDWQANFSQCFSIFENMESRQSEGMLRKKYLMSSFLRIDDFPYTQQSQIYRKSLERVDHNSKMAVRNCKCTYIILLDISVGNFELLLKAFLYFGSFLVEPKMFHYLHSDRNFRIFWVNAWLSILVPMTVFASLSRRNFGTSNRFVAAALSAELCAGQYIFGEIFPLLIFLNTFHNFAPAMPANSITSVQEFFVFKQTIKKLNLLENPMSPEPFVCRAKVPRQLKEENRALGTRMTISQCKILSF